MTYVCPDCKFMVRISRLNFSACKARFSASLAIFQREIRFEIHTDLSDCHVLTIISQNYAGSKQKSYKIKEAYMFAVQNKAKPNTESSKGIKLLAIELTVILEAEVSL